MPEDRSLSIVIPTYNEKENIQILIPAVKKIFSAIKNEIIVVDDSSPDGTGAAVLELGRTYPDVRLLTKTKKEGIGAALRLGYNNAKNDIILSTDADLSFDPQDMPKLYNKILEGYDIVVGAKHKKQGYYERPTLELKVKFLLSRLGNVMMRFLTGVSDVEDFTSNFRAITNKMWRSILTKENANIFLLEMLLKAKVKGAKITDIPVIFKKRRFGESKLKFSVEVPQYILGLKDIFEYRFPKKPS